MSLFNDNYYCKNYQLWRKSAPFLYHSLIHHQLTQPLLSVEILQQQITPSQQLHTLLVSLASTDDQPGCLELLTICTPNGDSVWDTSQMNQGGLIEKGSARVESIGRRQLDGEINKCRKNGQSNLLACKSSLGQIIIYPISHQQIQKPILTLVGHQAEGFAVNWHPQRNLIASGSQDGLICFWDCDVSSSELQPFLVKKYHCDWGNVNQVSWNKANNNILTSCGQGGIIALWDLRDPGQQPVLQKIGHPSQVTAMDFHPRNQYLLLTGCQSNQVALWDIRNLGKRLHSFQQHTDSVVKVQWVSDHPTRFVTASFDKRVMMFDIRGCGTSTQQSKGQLIFIHGGHRSHIMDLRVVGDKVLSCEQACVVQLWEPTVPQYDN